MYQSFIQWAREQGWTVALKPVPRFALPEAIQERYPSLPLDYLCFVSLFEDLANADETTWLLSERTFSDQSDDAFRWDAFEQISLEAAEGDETWQTEIRGWWSLHVPVFLSVKGEYAFYALNLDTGAVVHGYEPEFEDAGAVAPSFAEFIEGIVRGDIPLV